MVSEGSTESVQSNSGASRSLRNAGTALTKRIDPRRLIHEVRRYRRFKKSERSTYLKLRLTHELGLDSRKVSPAARSFVFVCYGNIMRSPAAEALFRLATTSKNVRVSSAGLNATPGTPAHPWAVTAAQELGISLSVHRSTLLTRAIVDSADAILAMDLQNQVELLTRFPDAEAKFFMLGTYSGRRGCSIEIQDPFYGDLEETRRCYRLLQICTQNLARSLDARAQPIANEQRGER